MDKQTADKLAKKIVNNSPELRRLRSISEGANPNGATHGGKGSHMRPGDKKAYAEGWERIFGKKDKTDDS